MTKDTTVSVRVTDEEKEILKGIAANIGTSTSQLVRKIILDYLKENKE